MPHSNLSIAMPQLSTEAHSTGPQPSIGWLPGSEGIKLACRIWQGSAKAPVVLYLHGIEGHSQWFENTAAQLNDKDITIYAPDRRGAGMNEFQRGHIDKYQTLLNDIKTHLQHIKQLHPDSPVFLIANCWSAKLATILLEKGQNEIYDHSFPTILGLVLICPAIFTKIDFPLFSKLKIALAWLRGKKYSRKYWPIPLTTNMLTDNQQYIDFLERDPLRLTQATASFFVQNFFATLKCQKITKFIDLPLLILQSGADQIVNVDKLKKWYSQIAIKDKSLHLFEKSAHSLDFDDFYFKEYAEILSNWIISRTETI